jgi:protein O-GlcNAc transferase
LSENLNYLLSEANAARDRANWSRAIELYSRLTSLAPHAAELKHNLGLSYLAIGKPKDALLWCSQALQQKPDLWQSGVLLGKAHVALDEIMQAQTCFEKVLLFDANNAEARLALADIFLNQFGEPYSAIECVEPLQADSEYQMDAQLTVLMASLYDRPHWNQNNSAKKLSNRIIEFSKQYLRMPGIEFAPLADHVNLYKEKKYRPRVALLSPQFFQSPVYFLTIDAWQRIARDCDVIIFNRGHKVDQATEVFRSLSFEWHDVQNMMAEDLARLIYGADIDVLYDLGGWMDPIALKALSAKPARQQFKWVGGQSATTGLLSFDGWIGDELQSPKRLQSLYSEPLIQIPKSYATYTPPAYLPKPAIQKSKTPCIFSNPAKVSQPFLERLSTMSGKKVFIHRQYRHPQVQERILAGLGKQAKNAEFIFPSTHQEALECVNAHATMIDTFPYSSGLTAREAIAMGTKIQVLEVGSLFCERHTAYVA